MTPSPWSQSRSASSSLVIVENSARLRAAALAVGHVRAGGHLLLVDIERRAALENPFHRYLPRIDRLASSVGAHRSEILLGVLVATVRCAEGPPASLLPDSWCQNVKRPRRWTTDRVSLISSAVCDGRDVMASP